MYVFDATPLIYLAKADRIELVAELPPKCVVPQRVYDEVVTAGIRGGHADARRVERAVDGGTLTVRTAEDADSFERLRRNPDLSDADAAVLGLADERDGTAVVDERYGRLVADAEGIPTRGTAYLVLRLLDDDVIDDEAASGTIDAMVDAGWYCSPDLYAKILRRIDDVS